MKTVNSVYPSYPTEKEPAWLHDQVVWQQIIWKDVEEMVFNLQKRIYKATKAGRLKQAGNLAK